MPFRRRKAPVRQIGWFYGVRRGNLTGLPDTALRFRSGQNAQRMPRPTGHTRQIPARKIRNASMDVFELDNALVKDYSSFARSFTSIKSEDIENSVKLIYQTGRFWPEPL